MNRCAVTRSSRPPPPPPNPVRKCWEQKCIVQCACIIYHFFSSPPPPNPVRKCWEQNCIVQCACIIYHFFSPPPPPQSSEKVLGTKVHCAVRVHYLSLFLIRITCITVIQGNADLCMVKNGLTVFLNYSFLLNFER